MSELINLPFDERVEIIKQKRLAKLEAKLKSKSIQRIQTITITIYCPRKCGMYMVTREDNKSFAAQELIKHLDNDCYQSNLPTPRHIYNYHRPFKSFSYYSYELCKSLGLIDKYMKWIDWCSLKIGFEMYSSNWELKQAWLKSIKYTCYNVPCIDCNMRDYNITQKHKLKVEESHKPGSMLTITKSGKKIYG